MVALYNTQRGGYLMVALYNTQRGGVPNGGIVQHTEGGT